MKTLLSAPYVGEIGWELLSWQGRVRRLFRHGGFDRLIVLGAPGKAAFYADMPLDYRPTDLSSLPGAAYEDRRVCVETRRPLSADQIRAALADITETAARELRSAGGTVEVLWPEYTGHIWPCDPAAQAFIRFRRPRREPRPAPHVVLVQRTRSFRSQDNWPADAWTQLAERLSFHGIHTSIYPHEASAAIEALSHCDLAVGQSTGGLHLAALCGCPAVVWGQPDTYRASPWQMSDRQRYQTLWNPLGTPVDFHACPSPPDPATATAWVVRALGTIARRTGTRAAMTAFRAAWTLRAWLDGHMVRRPWFRNCPWRVQRFVRYALI